jgi:hypothetical protein
MKKQLLGTTTLVAAGLLIAGGPAQDAFAAEPITVGFGGNLSVTASFFDQKDTGGTLRSYQLDDTGEAQFSGSTELDNGITVGVRFEFELHNKGGGSDVVDNRYISFSGGFGEVRIGSFGNVASAMHYENPSGAWEFSTNSPSNAVLSRNGNAMTSFVGTYQFTGGNAQKINYFTPRINGVQLGLTYQPDNVETQGPQVGGVDDSGAGVTAGTGNQSNIFAVGLNYQGAFDAANISASFGYIHGNEEDESFANGEDIDSVSAALTIGWGAFNVGAAYKHTDQGGTHFAGGVGSQETVGVGFNHTVGDLTWGLEFSHGDQETGSGTEDGLTAFGASATYGIGPGISFVTGVKYYEYDTDTVGGAAPDGATGGFAIVTYF